MTGQFVSPDTLAPDATNLFDYNRYMYVRGNPLKYTDPTGRFSEEELDKYLGPSWRDFMTDEWKYILLNNSGEIPAAVLGDLLVIEEGGVTTRGILVLDENERLTMWNVDFPGMTTYRAFNYTPDVVFHYRVSGAESASARNLHEIVQKWLPTDPFRQEPISFSLMRHIYRPGMVVPETKRIGEPEEIPANWFYAGQSDWFVALRHKPEVQATGLVVDIVLDGGINITTIFAAYEAFSLQPGYQVARCSPATLAAPLCITAP